MNKREVIQRRFLAGVLLILLSFIIISCSKDENNEPQVIFTIDLTKPENVALLTINGSVINASKGIIVINDDPRYRAYANLCTSCQNALTVVPAPDPVVLKCTNCQSKFYWDGRVASGPALIPLKVYSVVKSGNTLTITNP
jgi:cytochrome b6-f complex iron-sulfur subunit